MSARSVAAWSADDQRWMRRALRLASLSLGMTWPNPGVGCVIVRDGVLIGEGRHRICGEEHAEVAALRDCARRGTNPAGATAYVTLAPCTRHGRQPPCAEALARSGVAMVLAAVDDPTQDDPWMWFEQAGIGYRVGLCRPEAEHLHGGFLIRQRLGRPRFTAKWAITADGCTACVGGESKWISSPEALALSRRRRRAFDAVLIGHGTARMDDPLLAAPRPRRHGGDPGPTRIVIAADADLDPGARLVRSATDQPLMVMCSDPPPDMGEVMVAESASLVPLTDPHDPQMVAATLGALGFNEVLVEGGAVIHHAFLAAGLYDRIELYLAPKLLGGGLPVAAGPGVAHMAEAQGFRWEGPPRLIGDTVLLRMSRPF